MQNFILDMGYDEFGKLEELSYTLAYAITKGLTESRHAELLCDFNAQTSYSGAELLADSLVLAQKLKNLTAKKRIGIVIPPSRLGAICNYACVLAGKEPINLNFTLGKVAAESCVETADIDTMLCASPSYEKISKANPSFPWTKNVADISDMLASITADETQQIRSDIENGIDFVAQKYGIAKTGDNKREATLIFTSGSEGSPKAAILTERNIIANCVQTNLSKLFQDDDILLANLPIFHSFGLLFEVWYLAIFGQKTITLVSPLDIKNNIRAVREKHATCIIGSPTFFRAYLKHASREDMRTLRKAIAGAEKTPNGFHELWNEAFGDTYREGYGLTEATPVVGVNLPSRDFGYFTTGSRRGSIGKLFPGMQAKILNPATLEQLPFGEQGLLAMRGPNIFAGYLNNAEATKYALRGDWLVTGDLSRMDEDGFLYIDGRLSRFSKIGGEMVPHATVESALNNELGFAGNDIPVIAISSRLDEGKGEALVLLTTVEINLADAKNALRKAGISNLWHPKHLVKVDKIPLLPSGKMDLKAIGELAK